VTVAIRLDQKQANSRVTPRPTYWDSVTGLDTQISLDFEAALIMVGSSTREDARSRLSQQDKQTDRQKSRDAILKVMLTAEGDIATKQVEELNSQIGKFETFKQKFIATEELRQVPETARLVGDTQLGIDEMVMLSERAQHRGVVAAVVAARLEKHGVTDERDRQRKSWTRVLAAYQG